MRKTLEKLLAEYGVIAAVLYFTIFFLVLGGAYIAVEQGFTPKSAAGKTGTFVIAYVFTKFTQPFRIAGTIALTPFAVRLWDRMRGRQPKGAEPAADVPAESERSTSEEGS